MWGRDRGLVVNSGFSWKISTKSFSGKSVLGIPYTQSVTLGCESPIGGLWNLIVSSSSARIHIPGMMGTWSYGSV